MQCTRRTIRLIQLTRFINTTRWNRITRCIQCIKINQVANLSLSKCIKTVTHTRLFRLNSLVLWIGLIGLKEKNARIDISMRCSPNPCIQINKYNMLIRCIRVIRPTSQALWIDLTDWSTSSAWNAWRIWSELRDWKGPIDKCTEHTWLKPFLKLFNHLSRLSNSTSNR